MTAIARRFLERLSRDEAKCVFVVAMPVLGLTGSMFSPASKSGI
jgi:hypothetical protein